MEDDTNLKTLQIEWHSTTESYIKGFILSFILTSTSFLLVAMKWITGYWLVMSIATLGLIQAIVQLIFFMKAGKEEKPRWKTLTLFFMILVLLIIVLGSLWIMYDLDQRVMTEMNRKGH